MVPPQVPYQPRPSPMTSRTPNLATASKRSHKDPTKNEKSLQNTVEKLTLSRAKEIHRAAEALSKLNSSEAAKGDNSRNKEDKKVDNQKRDKGCEYKKNKYFKDFIEISVSESSACMPPNTQ